MSEDISTLVFGTCACSTPWFASEQFCQYLRRRMSLIEIVSCCRLVAYSSTNVAAANTFRLLITTSRSQPKVTSDEFLLVIKNHC